MTTPTFTAEQIEKKLLDHCEKYKKTDYRDKELFRAVCDWRDRADIFRHIIEQQRAELEKVEGERNAFRTELLCARERLTTQDAEIEQLRAGNNQLKRDLALVHAANARMREDLKEYENDPTR